MTFIIESRVWIALADAGCPAGGGGGGGEEEGVQLKVAMGAHLQPGRTFLKIEEDVTVSKILLNQAPCTDGYPRKMLLKNIVI